MLNEALKKLMRSKKDEGSHKMGDVERDAKTSVLEHMRDMAHGMMGEKLHGMKQVTVASPDPEGLSKGLEAARELTSAHETPHPDEDAEDSANRDEDAEAMHPEEDKTEHESATEDEAEEGSPAEEAAESPEEEAHEQVTGSSDNAYDHLSKEEVDHHIKKLQEHKQKKYGMK